MQFARLNSFWSNYLQITQDAKQLFDETYRLESEPTYMDNSDLYIDIKNKRFKYGTQVIIFAAMSMESFINDYATVNLGDSYFKSTIDKLNTVSKYLIAIQMITHKEFPKDSQAYEKLKFLFQIRNKLVHSKSKQIPFTDNKIDVQKYDKMVESYLDNWKETVDQCFNAIKICSNTLVSLMPDEELFILLTKIV